MSLDILLNSYHLHGDRILPVADGDKVLQAYFILSVQLQQPCSPLLRLHKHSPYAFSTESTKILLQLRILNALLLQS